MPQRDLLLPWVTALDNAALPLRIAGVRRGAARERARPLFAALGLDGLRARPPDELSGGMRQRVAFVRTLLAGKPVLALDEPFGALDALTRHDMQAWLAGALAREPRTVLLVTHDVEEARGARRPRRRPVAAARAASVAELDVALPRPRRAPTPRSSPCASRRWTRSGRTADARGPPRCSCCSARWEVYAELGGIDDFLLPAPDARSPRRCGTTGDMLWQQLHRDRRGGAAGDRGRARRRRWPARCAIHLSRTLRRAVYPLLVASQTIPIVIIAPLLVAWLGLRHRPQARDHRADLLLPGHGHGARRPSRVDPDLLKLMRTLDASRWQSFRRVEAARRRCPRSSAAPGSPSPSAVIGAVLAEQAGSSEGLGHLILQAIPQLETARAYAAVVVLVALLAIALFAVLTPGRAPGRCRGPTDRDEGDRP